MQQQRPHAYGFTLIEVMVVLLIIGVMLGTASLGLESLRGRDTERALERLRLVLEASAERASVRGEPVVLELLADGYRFAYFDTDGRWRHLNEPPVFTEKLLPADVGWGELRVNGKVIKGRRLMFGSLPPRFELDVSTPRGIARLEGSETGRVVLHAPPGGA